MRGCYRVCFILYFQVLHQDHNTWPPFVFCNITVSIFADDIALHCSIQTVVDCISTQKDITSILSCIVQNQFNFSTCQNGCCLSLSQIMTFKILHNHWRLLAKPSLSLSNLMHPNQPLSYMDINTTICLLQCFHETRSPN